MKIGNEGHVELGKALTLEMRLQLLQGVSAAVTEFQYPLMKPFGSIVHQTIASETTLNNSLPNSKPWALKAYLQIHLMHPNPYLHLTDSLLFMFV